MDVESPDSHRRHLGGRQRQPVERRSSKKSSSQDRHGKIYPDSFGDKAIRPVTPEASPNTSSSLAAFGPDYSLSPASPSPRSRANLPRRRREHSTSISNTDEESTFERRTRRSNTKSKATEETAIENSPSSFITKTRHRLGSITTSAAFAPQPPEDPVGSIGFPSIIQSPPLGNQGGSRQRLVKAPPRLASPTNGDDHRESGLISPIMNTDSSKILQLMKTTCGRMNGILFFRPTDTAPWASGYCAINVSTGSLINQIHGEPPLTKTLIPDLRGCSVRTLYDADTQGTYLAVSTASSGLGIQLRPPVPETFDSWLAALLCWQPIRPKGVQNKMTKPQTISMIERRTTERRRPSESTLQKSAAIIKVGKMLLWEGVPGTDPENHVPSKRISTYKQLRAISSCWQRVSCTLHENGHFKLLTESDAQLISFIHLSQLSRCAVQQLDPSVLDDEFCIALYPQYTAYPGSQAHFRPVFLSLESRVLFEVWFVLLRAFTVPELYGPKQLPEGHEFAFPNGSGTSNIPLHGMFRVERSLSIRLTEAKLRRAPEVDAKKPGQAKFGLAEPLRGEFYAEVLLDGEVRARTAVKAHTSSAFWREDFSFADLPPVVSSASVLIKGRNPAEKEWTMISRGQYDFSHTDGTPLSVGGDIEVSSHDTIFGKIELQLDDLDRGNANVRAERLESAPSIATVEKWWPVLDVNSRISGAGSSGTSTVVGDILMKMQLEETTVLMKEDYSPLLELLHTFSNGLTVQIAGILQTHLKQLSEIFLDIFQVSAHASEWIMTLVEDEIDGIHREAPPSRLRYSSRIHSNDSFEASENRELLVRDLGRSATVEANLLFRGNSLLTKALDSHMRRLGKEYLEETIGERLRDIDESDPECEVDPNRVKSPSDLNRNWVNLIALTSHIWKAISGSAARCPPELRLIFRHVRSCADDRYGAFLRTVSYSSVSGFLFLRLFCPAILNPKLFGLLKDHPRPKAQRTLTLIAKSLQGLANMTTFGSKEPWMEPMNKFLMASRTDFKDFVDQICSVPSERPTQAVSPSYATPIQILGRLPPTSREGFPSLPFLIDSAKNFSNLVTLWLDNCSSHMSEEGQIDRNLLKFHGICVALQQRTKDCLNRAEQAERPSDGLESKWEQLLEQRERSATFYDESNSKPTTPPADTALTFPPLGPSGKRYSNGYFSSALPQQQLAEVIDHMEDDTPPSSASVTWDQSRLPYTQSRHGETRGSTKSSKNSSTLSFDPADTARHRQAQAIRDASAKHRMFDFGGGASRRRLKDKDGMQSPREEEPNEF